MSRIVSCRHRCAALLVAGTAAITGVGGTTACRGTPPAFGLSLSVARGHADELLAALEERFTRIERSPAADAALAKIERSMLVPSRVYNDTGAWTAVRGDDVRVLSLTGHYVHDRYVVTEIPDAPPPTQLAATRDEIWLTSVGRNEYEWTTLVEQVIGSLAVADVDRIVVAMLAAAGATPGDSLRAGSVSTFPRSAAVLGELFSVDTVHATPRDGGATDVELVMGLHPDRLRPTYPAFASYLRKYLGPTRVRCLLRDIDGTAWLDLRLADERITLHFVTTREGHFAPMAGPPRPMPDSMVLSTDFRTKMWLFSLGMSGLTGDFVLVHTPHARGWQFNFHHEPKWHFPFAVDHLVKSSLRRPFSGAGAHYRVVVDDSLTDTTVLERDGGVAVQESTIMRWLGGLGANALTEFSGPVETQESAFLSAMFGALRDDVRADLTAGTVAGEVGDRP